MDRPPLATASPQWARPPHLRAGNGALAPAPSEKSASALPSLGHLDMDKIRRDAAAAATTTDGDSRHHHSMNSSGPPLASPQSLHSGPPPPYSYPSSANSSMLGLAGYMNSPDSRQTSNDDAKDAMNGPGRMSLPSIHEALGKDPSILYSGPPLHPPLVGSAMPSQNPAMASAHNNTATSNPASATSPTTPIHRSHPHDPFPPVQSNHHPHSSALPAYSEDSNDRPQTSALPPPPPPPPSSLAAARAADDNGPGRLARLAESASQIAYAPSAPTSHLRHSPPPSAAASGIGPPPFGTASGIGPSSAAPPPAVNTTVSNGTSNASHPMPPPHPPPPLGPPSAANRPVPPPPPAYSYPSTAPNTPSYPSNPSNAYTSNPPTTPSYPPNVSTAYASNGPNTAYPPNPPNSAYGAYVPSPSWRSSGYDSERSDDGKSLPKRTVTGGQHYGESVKRHLDIFDLETSLNEIAEGSGRALDFSRHFGQRAHETQRSGSLAALPDLAQCEDMIRLQSTVLAAFQRIREVVLAQEAAAAEQRSREEAATQRPHATSARTAEFPDTASNQSDKDPMGTPGAGGFAGSDPKKRKGRNAPPGRCHSCNRAETPEWRRGPDGARTLCNACGLHYAKLTRKMNSKAAVGGSNLRPKERGSSP